MSQTAVDRVGRKIHPFLFKGVLYTGAFTDLRLTSVDKPDPTEFQRVLLILQNRAGVRSGVHQIQFGQHPDRPLMRRVDLSDQRDGFRCRKILIGRGDRKQEGSRVGDVL